jgi:Tol biopolymer transport system component
MALHAEHSLEATGAVQDSAVRAQLETLLASELFSRSPRLSRFLRFIVEETLQGRTATLKEQVLGHEVYGKTAEFDGATNPIVRVDARRLRDKLREYYAQQRQDAVVISLPKGGYVPAFEFRTGATPAPTMRFPGRLPLETGCRAVSRNLWAWGTALIVGIVSTTVWLSLRNQPEGSDAAMPLTTLPGAEIQPALSPDGNLVAFSWSGSDQPGQLDIYFKAVDAEAVRRLTDNPAAEFSPAWSPNGQEIAFVRADEGVFIVSQLGGPERKVSPSGSLVGWTPDGKSVLIRDQEGREPFGLYQVALDTLQRRRLTHPTVGIGDWRFDVSPDGSTLAFIRYERPAVGDLYVMPMRGGEPRRLTDWNAILRGLAWTPDGRDLVYSAMDRLWRISASSSGPAHGSALRNITEAAESPSISRPLPGRPGRLAFQRTFRDVSLRLIDLDLPRLGDSPLQATPLADSTRMDSPGPFSPDATAVAFKSFRGGWSPELWVCGRDGRDLRQITHLKGAELVVGSWSPDGKRIAFDASVGGNSDIYSIDPAGGQPVRLTSDPVIDVLPWWSRDGRWIYYTSFRSGTLQIWRMPAGGGVATQITHNGGFEAQESQDGQYLYYLDRPPPGPTGASGTSRLMRARVDGSDEAVLLSSIRFHLWSVTDRGIVYLARERDADQLLLHKFVDGGLVALGRLPFRVASEPGRLTVSADGRWLLANTVDRQDADLMLLHDFR